MPVYKIDCFRPIILDSMQLLWSALIALALVPMHCNFCDKCSCLGSDLRSWGSVWNRRSLRCEQVAGVRAAVSQYSGALLGMAEHLDEPGPSALLIAGMGQNAGIAGAVCKLSIIPVFGGLGSSLKWSSGTAE